MLDKEVKATNDYRVLLSEVSCEGKYRYSKSEDRAWGVGGRGKIFF
jgi:hypothetical protein